MSKEVKVRQPRRLVRRATAALLLDCSTNMLKKLEREGRLTVVRLGGRDVFYPSEQIDALARGEE